MTTTISESLEHSYLQNNLLIAMPNLLDPSFQQSVTLICEHNEDGALGIVINQPLEMKFSEILDHLAIAYNEDSVPDIPVLYGGPVQPDRGFVIHSEAGCWKSSLRLNSSLYITTSLDILQALAAGDCHDKVFIVLGYAGWDAGQLESEILQNAWLNSPTDTSVVFDIPMERRWHAAARLLGVDINQLSQEVGHG